MTTVENQQNAVDQNSTCIAEDGARPPTLPDDGGGGGEDDEDGTLAATEISHRLVEQHPVKFLGGGSGDCFKCPPDFAEPPLGHDQSRVTPLPLVESSGTPPFVKWAQSLRNLLDNREGVELFKRYLQQERCEDSLDFWFACEGLKLQASDVPDRLHQLIKLIYRKYLRSHNAVSITSATRKTITDRLAAKAADSPPDQRIFDAAQREVEVNIRQSTYPNFLKSDIYLQYVQCAQNGSFASPRCFDGRYASTSVSVSGCCSLPSSRSSNSSSSDCDARTDNCGPLATVLEDSELNVAVVAPTLPLTSKHLMATQRYRAGYSDVRRPEAYAGVYLRQSPTSRAPNPYHALYASFIPGSAQDSELQSLSSDAHTDETISLTDSVEGFSVTNSRKYLRQQNRAMRQNANQNRDPFGQHTFIPRTQRLPAEKFPPSDPEKFAAILTEKLETVLRVQESQDKVNESLRKLEYEENKNFACRTEDSNHCGASQQQQQQQPQPPLSSVILTAIRDGIMGGDDDDQSILDEHVSRVWNDSSQQTPSSRSPPPPLVPPLRPHSPPARRRFTVPLPPPPILVHANPYHNKQSYVAAHHRHRKDRDLTSTFSSDSGAVPDYQDSDAGVLLPSSCSADDDAAAAETSLQQQQQPVTHKHGVAGGSRTKVVGEMIDLPPRVGLVDQYTGVPQVLVMDPSSRSRGPFVDGAKRLGGKKSFVDSSSSGVDSGVSVAYEPSQASSFNSREKVMSWVLESKKYCSSHTSDSEKDSSVRHKKPTYSSLSATSPGPNRQGRVKKQSAYTNSRSGSLERGSHMQWPNAQPNQPFMSDPSMPILPPPNTTTQLEEARRRLEDDTKAKLITKSKSSGLVKEKFYQVDMAKGVRQLTSSSGKVAPGGVTVIDSQDDATATKKPSKRLSAPAGGVWSASTAVSSSSSPAAAATVTPVGTPTEFTAVVYQFFGEPVPYLTKLPGRNVVLRQFKTLITKKSNFRYFFKKASDEFDSGCVYEELTDDGELLPLFEGKIFARLEAID